ncbi:ly6/PLAUR domain-containing protein 3-like [Rhinoderma darwinii]|uniref:ly6/PLAUR domain-containing protein 3-like n=1 Tax=Rhinoderma darwinii TaxID=43563 RepID=UPI003F67CAF0
MASNVALFLGLITSCLLVTGCLCLECFLCNESLDVGCSNSSKISCTGSDNICTAVSFSAKIGNQMESRIVKGCEKGFPRILISASNSTGIGIRASKLSCNSSMCNDKIIDLSTSFPPEQVIQDNGLECYSCISTNKSKCSKQSAQKVKCPVGLNTCYEAEGNLTIGTISSPIFVKQCSVPTNNTAIVISQVWYKISVIAAYCSGNLCNENIIFPLETSTLTTVTTIISTNTTKVQPVTTKGKITTSGIGRIDPCYVAIILLIVMESFL